MKNTLDKQNILCICLGVVLGAIYVVSGFSKAIDINQFSNTIREYGFGALSFVAPIVVVFEILLGVALIFNVKTKMAALASLVAIVLFSLMFIYANVFRGIENCGCFGSLNNDLDPIWVYVRNVLMFMVSLYVYKASGDQSTVNSYKKQLILITLCSACYLVGFSNGKPIKFKTEKSKHEKAIVGLNVHDTPLNAYISNLKTSKYMLFFFSYTCSHCLNSIENLKQYAESNYVDDIVLVGAGSDIDRTDFYKNFNLNFSRFHVDKKDLKDITRIFPSSYFVVNDTIRNKWLGALPAHQVIRKQNFIENNN